MTRVEGPVCQICIINKNVNPQCNKGNFVFTLIIVVVYENKYTCRKRGRAPSQLLPRNILFLIKLRKDNSAI